MITLTCDECLSQIIKTESCNQAIAYIHDHCVKDCGNRILCRKCASSANLPPCPICGRAPCVSRPPICNGYEVACMDNYHMISFHDLEDEKKVREQWCDVASAIATFMKGTRP